MRLFPSKVPTTRAAALPLAVLYRRSRACLSLLLSLLLISSLARLQGSRAQEPAPSPIAAPQTFDKALLHQALLDLQNSWTVMCVAAHPDDEDGSTLTVLRRKYGVHTVSLFSTYGEGGQNAVGPQLYEELGVIRARETIAAAEVQGSEPHFLGLRDFGFSKSAEETFRVWGEKEALRRMVLQIRELRPDVIITNHDTTSGHGHHQATGRLILQAFDAAADSKQFPEQLNRVSTWQAQRLFVRAFSRNQSGATTAEAGANQTFVTIDPNERDPIRGTTYAQQALAALQRHATQGPWPKDLPANGGRIVRYNLVRSAQSASPVPADAKTVLDGLHLPEAVAARLKPPMIDGKQLTEFVDNRGEALVALIHARKVGAFTAPAEVVKLDRARFHLMTSRLDRALATAAGVSLTLHSNEAVLVPGVDAQINVTLINTGDTDIAVRGLAFSGLSTDKPLEAAELLLPSTDTSQELKIAVPKTVAISVPSSEHLYDGRLFGERIAADAALEIEGTPFSVNTVDRIDVAPEVEIKNMEPSPYVWRESELGREWNFNVRLTNHLATPFRGQAFVFGANAIMYEGTHDIELKAHETNDFKIQAWSVPPPREAANDQRRSGFATLAITSPDSKEEITRRRVRTLFIDAHVPAGLQVGFVPSFDNTLQNSLSALGVNAKQLTIDDIQKGDLADYDTIIIDNRGYEAHPELIAANDRLLKFAEDGGTLIVFYQKANEWNPTADKKRPQLAPYPIVLSDARVTEENAPIKFLQTRHPLMNFPNRITQADFANWIQERGLYFPKDWDPQHYTALFATSDKGEPPLRGGLLVARYGKGNYIYTSMVWYRELRAGIPGAYRFFANMISYRRSIRR